MVSIEEESQIAGLTVVIDSTDFGFQQLRNIAISDMKYLAMFVQVRLDDYSILRICFTCNNRISGSFPTLDTKHSCDQFKLLFEDGFQATHTISQ